MYKRNGLQLESWFGQYLEMKLDTDSREAAEDQVSQMCSRLLANMVIEEYRFELEETS